MRTDFQKICMKLAALSIPVWIWALWQCNLPMNQYTFRAWEGLVSGRGWNAGFYPDRHLSMTEVGDLAPYTLNAVPHPAVWDTDHEGYRNREPVCPDPEFAIIGDSFAMGAGLSQDETLSEQLTRDSGRCARSFAGGKLGASTNQIFSDGLHPRWIVIVLSERNTHVVEELRNFRERTRIQWLDYAPTSALVRWSHFRKGFYSNYRAAHGVVGALHRTFLPSGQAVALFAPRTLEATPPAPELLFFGNIGNAEDGPDALEDLKNILKEYSKTIRSHGSRLIVTFVPNKESIYFAQAGKPESQLGSRLREAFRSEDFVYLDLIGRFKKVYREDARLLHHSDDTHWNARGVKLLSEMISAIRP